MSFLKASSRQVNPVVTAIVIVLVLGTVQYLWWQGLVAKQKLPPAGGMGGGGFRGPDISASRGHRDVQVDTLAGTPDPGDADGIGRDARFDGPSGLALDSAGNLYVADTRNNRVRVVAPDGRTRTLTGGEAGFQDGPVGSALFNGPSGVAIAPDGTVYVADTNNHRIRRIRDGTVTTVAGTEQGLADGSAASARFRQPVAITWWAGQGGKGELVVADAGNRRLRRVNLNGPQAMVQTLRTLDGVPSGVAIRNGETAIALPDQGVLDVGAGRLKNLPVQPGIGDDPYPVGAITLHKPIGVCSAPDGWYVADTENAALLKVRAGSVEVVAGVCQSIGMSVGFRDGAGNKALFGLLNGIVTDGKRFVYVSDSTNNAIRRITLP